jgi:hypothetical protein
MSVDRKTFSACAHKHTRVHIIRLRTFARSSRLYVVHRYIHKLCTYISWWTFAGRKGGKSAYSTRTASAAYNTTDFKQPRKQTRDVHGYDAHGAKHPFLLYTGISNLLIRSCDLFTLGQILLLPLRFPSSRPNPTPSLARPVSPSFRCFPTLNFHRSICANNFFSFLFLVPARALFLSSSLPLFLSSSLPLFLSSSLPLFLTSSLPLFHHSVRPVLSLFLRRIIIIIIVIYILLLFFSSFFFLFFVLPPTELDAQPLLSG